MIKIGLCHGNMVLYEILYTKLVLRHNRSLTIFDKQSVNNRETKNKQKYYYDKNI